MHRDGADETGITEIKNDNGMTATVDYSECIMDGRIRFCKAMRNVQERQPEIKSEQAALQDYTAGLFVNNGLRFISCLSALNLRIADAKRDLR